MMKKMFMYFAVLFIMIPLLSAQSLQKADFSKESLDVLQKVTLTVIVDNFSGGEAIAEWGVSYLIETGEHRILFDTGNGIAFPHNVRIMKLDLQNTDAIVISHEHSDHTGALKQALKLCGPCDFYVHPAAFETKYWKRETGPELHSMPLTEQQIRRKVDKLVFTKEPTVVCKGVVVTGEIPRIHDFEDTGLGEWAFLDKEFQKPDLILDDQSIFFRVPEGVVIVLGCGHAGLINIMDYVSKLTGEDKIFAVIGGTHLHGASPERLEKTIEALKKYDVKRIMLSHCTGLKTFAKLSEAIPGRCGWPGTGSKVLFGGQ